MPHRQVIRDIQAGLFKPVYLLHGEEPYFIDQIAKAEQATADERELAALKGASGGGKKRAKAA